MDAFLDSIRAEGPLDSSGRFTIDRLRISELYENAQKAEPCLYFLKAIQVGVASASPRVDIKLLSTAVRVIFSPGRSIADDFQSIFAEGGGGGISDSLRWSVHCALAAGVSYVQCHFVGPEPRDCVEFVFRAQGSSVRPHSRTESTRRVELSFQGFRATSDVRTFLGIYERIRLHRAATQHCGFGLTPIYLDGFLLKPDLQVLVTPGVSFADQASRTYQERFAILQLGRRQGSPRQQFAVPQPATFHANRVQGPGLLINCATEVSGDFRRPYYLLDLPAGQDQVVYQDIWAAPLFGSTQKGDYRGPGTLKLVAKKNSEAKTIATTLTYHQHSIRHFGLAGCEECLVPPGGETALVIARCFILSSLDKGRGSYVYVLKDGVLLRPVPFDVGLDDVNVVVADGEVDLDASGFTPIHNERFDSLLASVRAVTQTVRDFRAV